MNDKEVKDLMLQSYRMSDFEHRFGLALLYLLIAIIPVSLILVITLLTIAIVYPKQGSNPAPVQQPIEMSVEK